jgi:bifunctional non-homologous end joining protein LigD
MAQDQCVLSEAFVVIGSVDVRRGPRCAGQPEGGAVRLDEACVHRRFRTGFSDAVATMLRGRLDPLATPKCAVAGLKTEGAVWVRPDLQAEIAYHGVPTAGELRHASFKGLVE